MIVFALFAGRNHHGMLIKNRKAKLGVLFYSLRLSPSNTHTFHFRLSTIRYAGQTPRELVVIKCFYVTTLKWSLKERNEVFITGSPLLNYKATQTQSFFNTWTSYLETSRGLQNISKKWKGLKKNQRLQTSLNPRCIFMYVFMVSLPCLKLLCSIKSVLKPLVSFFSLLHFLSISCKRMVVCK